MYRHSDSVRAADLNLLTILTTQNARVHRSECLSFSIYIYKAVCCTRRALFRLFPTPEGHSFLKQSNASFSLIS